MSHFHLDPLQIDQKTWLPTSNLSPLSGLRGSVPKSGPLDFVTKNTFPLFFVSEEALVGIY